MLSKGNTVKKDHIYCILEERQRVANAEWLAWGSWTKCSVTCGIGTQSKSRKCNTEQPSADPTGVCIGNRTVIQACKEKECPQGS